MLIVNLHYFRVDPSGKPTGEEETTEPTTSEEEVSLTESCDLSHDMSCD